VSYEAPLFGVVSRLTSQKGLDLLLAVLPDLLARGAQLAVLGSGEKALEDGFADAALANKGAVGCAFAYDEALAHLMQAGSDFILVPSRFEPCGLTQLYALRYGATPVVARVGGLADTIIDANEAAIGAGVATGVQFAPPDAPALSYALERALAFYRDVATMRRIRLNGMRADVSWRGPAKRYAAIYHALARVAA
jgi:starch synthase